MEKKEQLYEGKAKKVFATDDPALVIVSYKDDATAFNGLKKGTIAGKGVINNRMSNLLMRRLEEAGVPTHFVQELSDRDTLVKKVSIVPLEVIVRNVAAGSFSKRYGVEEGVVFDAPTVEFSYKNDDLGDPLLNTSHALALKLATAEELEQIKSMALRIDELLKAAFHRMGIELVDFKLEFGRTPDGKLVLADEISPDTCRLWDEKTHEKLDKDLPPGSGRRGGRLSGGHAPSDGGSGVTWEDSTRNAACSAPARPARPMWPRWPITRCTPFSTAGRRAAASWSTTTACLPPAGTWDW